MKKILFCLICVLACAGSLPALADGPLARIDNKLMILGASPEFEANPNPELEKKFAEVARKSDANCHVALVRWSVIQPNADGKFDLSSVTYPGDMKAKLFVIDLENSWADSLFSTNPEKYDSALYAFIRAVAPLVPKNNYSYYLLKYPKSRSFGRAADYARKLATVRRALLVEKVRSDELSAKAADGDKKAADEMNANRYYDRYLIADIPGIATDNAVQELYDSGAKDYFDAIAINIPPASADMGVDIDRIIGIRWALERNNDAIKRIFVKNGIGAYVGSDEQGSVELVKNAISNAYRNLLTDRDVYSPEWLLGAVFPLNDAAADSQGMPVSDDANGFRKRLGVCDKNGNPKDESLAANFMPGIPELAVRPAIKLENAFSLVVNQPYAVSLELEKVDQKNFQIEGIDFTLVGAGVGKIEATPEGELPKAVEPGKTVSMQFKVSLPADVAGKQIVIKPVVRYEFDGKKGFADAWITCMPTNQLELNMIPTRIIWKPDGKNTVGVSVINHLASVREGKISFTASKGISVNPPEKDFKLEPQDLKGFVLSLTADENIEPGHYAVFAKTDGANDAWSALDIPGVVAKAGEIKIDGSGSEWKTVKGMGVYQRSAVGDAAVRTGDIKAAYDDKNLYMLVSVKAKNHVKGADRADALSGDALVIGIDTLLDGARTSSGGYKPDDWELAFADTQSGPVSLILHSGGGDALGHTAKPGFAFKHADGVNNYEIAIPWGMLNGFGRNSGRMIGLSAMAVVRDSDGKPATSEWAGGISDNDPRRFMPMVIAK